MQKLTGPCTIKSMKTLHLGLVIVALGLLSGCWYGYGTPPPSPITKTRPCSGNDFLPPVLQLSRNKAKIGDSIVLVGIPSSINSSPTYDSAQNVYVQPDLSTCPKVKLVRFLVNDVAVGEAIAEPYRLAFTLKAGEKGIPASSAGNAGTTVDVAVTAQTVYADDKLGQFPQQYGPSPVPNFLSVEYP